MKYELKSLCAINSIGNTIHPQGGGNCMVGKVGNAQLKIKMKTT